MRAPRNRNTVFTPLSYESVFSHLNELEREIEFTELSNSYKRQVPIYVCTIIEQFCRVRKMHAYGDGEAMPQSIRLNKSLLMDMLDWSDGWCTDNTNRHETVLSNYAKDANDNFEIGVKNLHVLVDDACHIRPPLVVESLVASTPNFQGIDAVNSLDITKQTLNRYRGVGIGEYEALFDLRHTNTHTLSGERFSPRSCVALAKDLFETVLGRKESLFHRGCALSNTNRHTGAVECLLPLHDRCDWKYLLHCGRSMAHIGLKESSNVLDRAAESLRSNLMLTTKCHAPEAAWLRMEAARALCDIADGFRAAESGHTPPTCGYMAYVREAVTTCSDLAESYWLVSSRLSEFRFPPDVVLECLKKAYCLVQGVDTAYAVGVKCFEMELYQEAREWLKKAERHDNADNDVKNALKQVEIRLAAMASRT